MYEKHLLEFIILTLMLGGWLAYMTGRAFASTWRGYGMLIVALLFLGLVNRFIHFSVVEGSLFSLKYYLSDTICLIIIGIIGFQIMRTKQMTTQYWWLYERMSLLTWRKRAIELSSRPIENNA
jgi:hypothetical protein